MWPFNKSFSLSESGILSGMTDWHSHILPGVDDGIQDLSDSLSVLEEYERLGIKKVWLTPHVMEDFPNTTDNLRQKFDELKKLWKGDLEIALASENMLDSVFEERLENHDFLPIGDSGNHLLVETSYFNPPFGMKEMIERAMKSGYQIILAHPERYRYMEEKDYIDLKNKGVKFQMNLLSPNGFYGDSALKKSRYFLKNNMVDFIGSDIHRLEQLLNNLESPYASKDIVKIIKEVAG